MFREFKRSSRATTNTKGSGKHSSSEPSTPGPRLTAMTPKASTAGIINGLQNLSFQSSEGASDRNLSGRVPSNPIPIPPHPYMTLASFVAPSIPQDEMKLNDSRGVRSPFTSMTTESAIVEDDDGSTLAVNDSPKQSISPESLGMEFDSVFDDQCITLENLTSDDEMVTTSGNTKRPASRSIFSYSVNPEPMPPRSQPINIPLAGLRRTRSQE
jgi:hypothetical protein